MADAPKSASQGTQEKNDENKARAAAEDKARREEIKKDEQEAKELAARDEADAKLLEQAKGDKPVEVTGDNRDAAERLVSAGKASFVTEQSGPGGLDVKQTLSAS